jgi:hypothetical protein
MHDHFDRRKMKKIAVLQTRPRARNGRLDDRQSIADEEQAAKKRFRLWHENSPSVGEKAIVAKMIGKPMTQGYVTAEFAMKAGYFLVGALVLVFVGMLMLTIYA